MPKHRLIDVGSGLVCIETTLQAGRNLQQPCICFASQKKEKRVARRNAAPPRLESLAIRSLRENISHISDDALLYIPEAYLIRLWTDLNSHSSAKRTDLHVWCLFAHTSIVSDESIAFPQILTCACSAPNIPATLRRLLPVTKAWMVHLEVWNLNYEPDDVEAIISFPSLRRLLMSSADTGGEFSDRHIRGWAAYPFALLNLECLFVFKCQNMTRWCLDHLQTFPKLRIIGFAGRSVDTESLTTHATTNKRPASSSSFQPFVSPDGCEILRNGKEMLRYWYQSCSKTKASALKDGCKSLTLTFSRVGDRGLLAQQTAVVLIRKPTKDLQTLHNSTQGAQHVSVLETPSKKFKFNHRKIVDIGNVLSQM